MNLLLDEIDVAETAGDPSAVEVLGVAHDSRQVVAGDLFCCLPGLHDDGHVHAADAVARGAVGIVCERVVPELLGGPTVQARVPRGTARQAMARIAAAFWGHPSHDLITAGVTGTNGKTTVTHLLAAVLERAGHPTAVIGTLSGTRTTPESTELQRRLHEFLTDNACGGSRPAVTMEVSSHALVQHRVDAIHFDVAVFTNLSHDHLDYHGDMDSYFEAKASLFTPERAVRAVVNADDPWGRRLLHRPHLPMVAVHEDQVSKVEIRPGASTFTWRGRRVELALTGRVNVFNALLAAEAALCLGVEPDAVVAGLAGASPVAGRLEVIAAGGPAGPPFAVLVDYAHTPAGLEVVLAAARSIAAPGAKVLVVFGCGGDRDRSKRPVMGAAAVRLADVSVLTSDNPRTEEPLSIIDEVLAGVDPGALSAGRLVVEADRRTAIARALGLAGAGDTVVIAGKGHEAEQEVAGVKTPFDDRVVARELLAERWPGDPAGWLMTGTAGR